VVKTPVLIQTLGEHALVKEEISRDLYDVEDLIDDDLRVCLARGKSLRRLCKLRLVFNLKDWFIDHVLIVKEICKL
ncbi:unnamed protein product, partial [Didymodactylos carnosus]